MERAPLNPQVVSCQLSATLGISSSLQSKVESLLPTPSSPGSSSTEILALGSESASIGCAAPGRVVRATEKGPGPREKQRRRNGSWQHHTERVFYYSFLYKNVHRQTEVRG